LIYSGLYYFSIQLAAYASDYFIGALVDNWDCDPYTVNIFSRQGKGVSVAYFDLGGVGPGYMIHYLLNDGAGLGQNLSGFLSKRESELSGRG